MYGKFQSSKTSEKKEFLKESTIYLDYPRIKHKYSIVLCAVSCSLPKYSRMRVLAYTKLPIVSQAWLSRKHPILCVSGRHCDVWSSLFLENETRMMESVEYRAVIGLVCTPKVASGVWGGCPIICRIQTLTSSVKVCSYLYGNGLRS